MVFAIGTPKPKVLRKDYETYCDVSLPDVGASVYSRHGSCEVLMDAYAFDRGPVKQWIPAIGEPMPAELEDAMQDPDIVKAAWNAPFEIAITRNVLGMDVDVRQWKDTMVQGLHCSLPGKLEKAGEVLKLPMEMQKDRRGKALMRKFSMPFSPKRGGKKRHFYWWEDPEDWEAYLSYNRSDVVAERNIAIRLEPYEMSDEEWELWWIDQEINNAGVPINQGMVRNAISVYEEALERDQQLMNDLTGLANANSLKQLLPWMQDQGYMFDDCQKSHIKTARLYFDEKPDHWDMDQWDEYRCNHIFKEVLDLRLDTSRTSIKKYYALDRATDEDGNLRGTLQMNGAARTGRYAGRIFQPQNLPRPEKRFEDYQATLADGIYHLDLESLELIHGSVYDVLASGLRPACQAPEGYTFVDADLSAIENRVLGWLAEEDKILNVFRQGRDPYIAFATYLYETDYDKLWHEYKVERNGAKRTIAKPGTLGCGYGMGAGEKRVNRKTGEIEGTGLLGYAWNMGVKHFTPEDAKKSVDTFRETFDKVPDYWNAMERAAKKCIKTQREVRCGHVRFVIDGPWMKMILPSGRPLYYLRPRLEMQDTPWGEKKLQITYEGMNDRKQWVRTNTTRGKIVENADQAISRDLLVHGLKLAIKEGLDVRLHVHDQILGLVLEEDSAHKLQLLIDCMEASPWWADGLPLGSEGHVSPIFIKD